MTSIDPRRVVHDVGQHGRKRFRSLDRTFDHAHVTARRWCGEGRRLDANGPDFDEAPGLHELGVGYGRRDAGFGVHAEPVS